MQLTEGIKHKPQWAKLIRQHRINRLKFTQGEFGAMFGVTQSTVAHWESGKYDPPSDVTWWLYRQLEQRIKRAGTK